LARPHGHKNALFYFALVAPGFALMGTSLAAPQLRYDPYPFKCPRLLAVRSKLPSLCKMSF
jgi:hypothetical protein